MRLNSCLFVAVGLLAGCGDSGTETNPEPEGEVLLDAGIYVVSESEVVSDGCGQTLIESVSIAVGSDPHELTIDVGSVNAEPVEVVLEDGAFTLDVSWEFEVVTDDPEPCVVGVRVVMSCVAGDSQTFSAAGYTHTLTLESGPTEICVAELQTEYPMFTAEAGCEQVTDVTLALQPEG